MIEVFAKNHVYHTQKAKKPFMALFMDGVQQDSNFFTTKFAGVPGTPLYNWEGWSAESTLEPPSGFEPRTSRLGIQHPDN